MLGEDDHTVAEYPCATAPTEASRHQIHAASRLTASHHADRAELEACGDTMAESSGEISNTSDLFKTLAEWNDELKRLGIAPGNLGVSDEGVPHG